MHTFGVLCSNTNDIVYLGEASDPENACYRAIGTGNGWGRLSRFKRFDLGEPKTEDSRSWLCFIVFDVSGVLEPDPNVRHDDQAIMNAIGDDMHVGTFIAEQL
ncbi:hypothetical protein [Dyella sp. S184]|uniref:hypothetical protein n=1 Tax=Dyella sp. S184 TaxID=1641862 RepID=UPI00131EBC05|nr:hypothetical protein [Dyella sp. S184]